MTGIRTVGEYEKTVGYAYKIDILKMATKNLMKCIEEEGDYTLNEAMFMYSILKIYVVKNAFQVKSLDEHHDFIREYDPAFLENEIEIDAIFKEFIREKYNLTEGELKEAQQTQYDVFYKPILETQEKKDDIDGKKLTERFPLLQTIFERYYVSSWDLEKFETEYETSTTNTYRKPYTLEPKYDR